MGLRKLETDTESMEWLNSFLVKFWLIYEPVLSEQVITIGNQVLADATPGFIESLSLDTFTLGTKPPRIDHVRTFPKTEDDVAVMDWKFSFTPNDVQDLTARQLKSKVNPKVALGVRIGKGIVSKSLPILVEDMSFAGLMRVRIKMMTTFPHVQTVDVSFLEPPEIDFVLKPIGGETLGFDINIIPGLSKFIKEMIDANAGPMLYAPNSFQLNVEQMLAGAGLDSSIGVLAVTINYAKNLKGSDAIGNTVDPYIKLSFNDRQELARTSIKQDTKSPTWKETKYLLVKNLNEVLSLELIDFNDFRKDKSIGLSTYPLEQLKNNPDVENITSEVLAGTKNRGGLCYSLHWYPVLEGKKLDDGTVEPPPESKSGIVKFTVHQCKDLDAKKSLVGQLSTYADLQLDGKTLITSKTVKRNNNPVWDHSYEFLVPNKAKAKLGAVIRDSRGMAVDPVIGSYKLSLQTLLAATEKGEDWFDLTPVGRVRLSANWKPVAIKDVGGSSYVEPIGVLRINVLKATGLRNLETIGTIDPYVRVLLGGFAKGRTGAKDSTLDPVFNEIIYVPIQSETQDLIIEAMDVEKNNKDRGLGSHKVNLSKFIKTDSSGHYLEYKSNNVLTGQLVMPRKGAKGTISYSVEFYPSLPVMDIDEANELKKAKEAEAKKLEEAKDAKKDDKKDEKDEKVEEIPDNTRKLLDIPLAKLIESQSGVIAVTVEDVSTSTQSSFLRIFFDQGAYPAFFSSKLKGSKNRILESSDFMVRELEYSQTIFELVQKEDSYSLNNVLATVNIPTLQLLKDSYEQPKVVTLTGKGGTKSQVKIRTRYFPTETFTLNPVESVNNQGTVIVNVIGADDIEAADRGGKSDPYLSFFVDGNRVYKTQTIKKTLNPVWNEKFEASINDRLRGQFYADLFDWDMGPGDDDYLGRAIIPIDQLEPLKTEQLTLALKDHKGAVRLGVQFRPGYVRKAFDVESTALGVISSTRVGSSVSGVAGGVSGGVENAASGVVGGVGSVVGGVGSVVGGVGGKGAGLLKSAFGRGGSNKNGPSVAPPPPTSTYAAPDAPLTATASAGNTNAIPESVNEDAGSTYGGGGGGGHRRAGSITSSFAGGSGGGSDYVSGTVTILAIRGVDVSHLQARAYMTGKREKELFKSKSVKPANSEAKFDESFTFKGPLDSQLVFKVKEHKSIGRDNDVGQSTLSLSDIGEGEQTLGIGPGELVIAIRLALK